MNDFIANAKAAQLVSFYNQHAAKPVSRFSDRAAAEKRVRALIADLGLNVDSQGNVVLECDNHSAGVAELPEEWCCPNCGIHLSNGVGHHGDDVNGKIQRHQHFDKVCLACDHEFGEPLREVDANRSAGVAKSWKDPAVKAARSARHFVRVNGQEFRSVRAAFVALQLPLKEHIRFRMELKAAGQLNAYGKSWEALEL